MNNIRLKYLNRDWINNSAETKASEVILYTTADKTLFQEED